MNNYQEALNDIIKNNLGNWQFKNDSFWLLQELIDKTKNDFVKVDLVYESANRKSELIIRLQDIIRIDKYEGEIYCFETQTKKEETIYKIRTKGPFEPLLRITKESYEQLKERLLTREMSNE